MKKIILLSCYYLLSLSMILAEPSSLDTSFNNSGATDNLFAAYTINQAQSIDVQLDGKIITAGISGDNCVIVRYNNDGSLDKTFNPHGVALGNGEPGYLLINLGTQSAIYGVAVQPDNKIVVAGYVTINNVDNAFIARYHPDASLDLSFGTTGYITTTFRAQSQLLGVKLQANGSIVVTGWASYNGFANALVARYTKNGILDTTFNTTGYVTTLIGGVFTKGRTVQIQADGKIIIAGQAEINNIQQLIVIRYNSDGSLDRNFNRTGNNPGSNYPLSSFLTSAGYGMALQADQKIICVGATNQYDLGFDNQFYTIVRFNSDGTLDTSFNKNDTPGYILSDIGLQASGAIVQTNGQIVTCGFNYSNNYIVVVVRYNNDGTIDPTFNFAINQTSANSMGNAITLQSNGKIVVSGTVGTNYTTP